MFFNLPAQTFVVTAYVPEPSGTLPAGFDAMGTTGQSSGPERASSWTVKGATGKGAWPPYNWRGACVAPGGGRRRRLSWAGTARAGTPTIYTSSWTLNGAEVLTCKIAPSEDGDDVPSRTRLGPRGVLNHPTSLSLSGAILAQVRPLPDRRRAGVATNIRCPWYST